MRVDAYLVEKGIVSSKSRAQQLIRSGKVMVNGKVVKKTGAQVHNGNNVSVDNILKFVSRGGNKLEHALDSFNINVKDVIVADVGASTGGFTDLLLKRGARKVFAIDVAKDQLHSTLRQHPQVINMSGTDIRKVHSLPEKADLVTIDVSLLPLRDILPKAKSLLRENGKVIALVKPQFEVDAGRKGIVSSKEQREKSISEVIKAAEKVGLQFRGIVRSPLQGGVANKGNIEYLVYFDAQTLHDENIHLSVKKLLETEK